MVLLTAILVAVLRTLGLAPVLILPEYQEWYDTQCMEEKDNGLHTMKEALLMMPRNRPSSHKVPNPKWPSEEMPYVPAVGSIAPLVGIARDDDDPEFIEYMRGFAPVVAKVREALAKPCMKPTERPSFSTGASFKFATLRGPLLGYARFLDKVEEKPADAVQLALDLGALERRFELECLRWYDEKREEHALDVIQKIAHRTPGAEELRTVQDLLSKAGEPFPSRKPVAEFYWRRMDGTSIYVHPREQSSLEKRIDWGVRRWFLRRAALFIRKHREELLDSVECTPPEFAQWIDGRRNYNGKATYYLRRANRYAAMVSARYRATVVTVAVERYQREHGTYPETLEALVPTYLATVPEDPISGNPFAWQRLDKSYGVYSVGESGDYKKLAGMILVVRKISDHGALVEGGKGSKRPKPRQRPGHQRR